jgi:hypothetical protein
MAIASESVAGGYRLIRVRTIRAWPSSPTASPITNGLSYDALKEDPLEGMRKLTRGLR